MKYIILLLVISTAIIGIDYSFNNRTDDENTDISTIKAKVIKAGLFKVIRSGGLVNSTNTSTGKAISKPVIQMVKTSNRIPLIKDAHMSLQYRIWNLPDQPAYIKLKRVLKHPPITLPDRSVSTGSEYMITSKVSIGQVIAYTGYGLNEDYEMVQGDWTFQIWREDKKLIEQTFTTYLPDDAEIQQLGNLSPSGYNNALMASKSASIKKKPDKKNQNTQTAAKRNWIN